jgi:hypothetical protein
MLEALENFDESKAKANRLFGYAISLQGNRELLPAKARSSFDR